MRVSGKEQSKSGITLSGDYAGDTDRGQRARRRSHGVGPLGHCSGRPHTVPLGVTPQPPFSGVHTHAVSSLMGSPTQSRNHTSFRGQITDDRAFLRGPLSSPTHGLRLPRWEHLRLPGTGEHGGSRGQASTEAWERACGGRGLGPGASAESGDPNHRLPAELPPDSR